jgi:hypothetical protein
MRNIPDLLLQAAAPVSPPSDTRAPVIFLSVSFVLFTLLAISPIRFFNVLAFGRQKVTMGPLTVLIYRILGIVCATGTLREIYNLVVQSGRIH